MSKNRFNSEQIIATLRQIEVQLAQGRSIAVGCKESANLQLLLSDQRLT